MTTIDERVAFLEGKVEEHSGGFGELRDTVRQLDGRITALDQKLDRLIAGVNDRVDALDQKLDRLIAGVNGRVDALDQKLDRLFAGLDQRITQLDEKVDQRIARLDEKMSRQFLWILGVQIAVLIAVVGALGR